MIILQICMIFISNYQEKDIIILLPYLVMNTVTNFVEKYPALFEAASQSENPQEYLKGLQDSYEKNLLLHLISPYSDDYKQILETKFKMNSSTVRDFVEWKRMKKILNTNQPSEIQQILKSMKGFSEEMFDYPKPTEYQQNQRQMEEQKQNKLPNNLKQLGSLPEILLNELEDDQSSINSFTNFAITQIPEQKLLNLKSTNKNRIFTSPELFNSFSDDFTLKFISGVFEEKVKSNKNYKIDEYLLKSLTNSHFQKLANYIPSLKYQDSYLTIWFDRNFVQKFDKFKNRDLSINQKNEKRNLLMEAIQFCEKQNNQRLNGLIRRLKIEVLQLDILREDFSKDYFLAFLKDYQLNAHIFRREIKHHYDQLRVSLEVGCRDESKLAQQYLKGLFTINSSEGLLSELQKYFRETNVRRIYAEVILLTQGATAETEAAKFLTNDQIREIKERKWLEIQEKTQKKFKVDEDIKLELKVKNIKEGRVKVYAVDLEKVELQDKMLDVTEDLSFIEPTKTEIFTIEGDFDPYKQIHRTLQINQIEKHRGMWIVELETDQISSRAIIYRGGISMSQKHTSAGVELTFFNELGKQIQELEIWVDNKKYSVKKTHHIPYAQEERYPKIIANYGKISETFSCRVPKQRYDFNVGYIYGPENFIVGNKCQVILHPRLKINGHNVSMKLLKKIMITATLINNVGLKNTFDYENIELSNNQDYILEFPVQSYTKQIIIEVEGKINLLNEKEQKVRSSKSITIDLNENSSNILDLYMKPVPERGYCVFVKGKNGEAIPQSEVTVEFQIKGSSKSHFETLLTDKDGIVSLGNIKNYAKYISVMTKGKSGAVKRIWSFYNQRELADYQSLYLCRTQQQLTLPWPFKENSFMLLKYINNAICTQICNEGAIVKDSRLIISGLAAGIYRFVSRQNDIEFDINVRKSAEWQNKSQIYDDNTGLIHTPPKYEKGICLKQPQFTKTEDNKLKISMGVSAVKNNNNLRAHLIASNFVNPEIEGIFNISDFRVQSEIEQSQIVTKICQFYNNKKLSEEASYVMNRVNQQKYIGNNLEKPRIFLKRIEVKDTNDEEEILGQAENYMLKQARGRNLQQCCMAPQRSQNLVHMGHRPQNSVHSIINSKAINTHNNFLSIPAEVVSNNKGLTLQFTLSQGYTHFRIIVLSSDTAIQKNFDYPAQRIQSKSLTHIGLKEADPKKGWTMSREIYPVANGQSLKVGRDSTWCAVGFQNLINFAKIKGARLEDWVGSWNTYEKEEKMKVYDDKVCHELNTFIKFNDPDFFAGVVKPFIINKVSKTFVDLCLLEDPRCLNWASIDKLQELNEFEKVLLIKELMRDGNKKVQAQSIAGAMQNVSKAHKISFNRFKNQFDTIVSAEAQKLQEKSMKKKSKAMNSRKERFESKCDMMQMRQQSYAFECAMEEDYDDFQEQEQMMRRQTYKRPFQEMEKTKQYTQTTYSGLKNPKLSKSLISPSPFWSSIAQSFSQNKNQFVTENFMYLNSALEFTLAACFIPNQKVLPYNLSTSGEHNVIAAEAPFLVFVKEVKQIDYEKKFGVMLNQRFFNPDDMYYYEEDGTRIEKEVTEFIVRRTYMVQTLVTNTSGTQLELQLLIDIPQGSIPLETHQYTQIHNITLSPYTTREFKRVFYFPTIGSYQIYSANACRGNSIIAKADRIPEISVAEFETKNAMSSFDDILRSGNKEEILKFLENKNIFDSRIFDISNILWMLKDKAFFNAVIKIFRNRRIYYDNVWMFGIYHKDAEIIKQFFRTGFIKNNQQKLPSQLTIFEYFPYYSRRTHKFQNESKSTIRNKEFKSSYYEFLFTMVIDPPKQKHYTIVLIYYLLLQDRIDEASALLQKVSGQVRKECPLQLDYIECFIDMYKGYPNFSSARQISKKYVQYPVHTWRKMFQEIVDTLKEYDSTEVPVKNEIKVNFETKVLNQGQKLSLSIPPETEIEVLVYEINLELYFSQLSFQNGEKLSPFIVPNIIKTYESQGKVREETFIRPENVNDAVVQVYQSKGKLKKKKVTSLQWSNPKVQVNVKQQHGFLQVFYDGKKLPGSYCKVYQQKSGAYKFYRDGYTDITGTFKYALADLDGISEFAVLIVTDKGGSIIKVKPPSKHGYF